MTTGQHLWLIFADTNSTVTKVYIDYYLKENISQEEFYLLDPLYQVTQAREKWDLIFVILPKSNYVDDGSRDMTMADNRTRDWFTKHLLDLLSPFKDKIVILGENCDSDSFFLLTTTITPRRQLKNVCISKSNGLLQQKHFHLKLTI